MNSGELLRMALLNLKRRKVRTFLAVMGVIIGTCAIVVMLSLGLGLSRSFTDQIDQMGDIHIVNLYSRGGQGFMGGMPGGSGNPQDKDRGKLTEKNLAAIRKIPGVTALTPVDEYYGRLISGRYSSGISIIGLDTDEFEAFGRKVAEGRMVRKTDKNALVFGSDIVHGFWDERSETMPPMGKDGKPLINLMTDKLIFTQDQEYMGSRRGRDQGSGGEQPKYELHRVKGVGILEEAQDRFSYAAITSLEMLEKIKKSDEKAQKDAGNRGGFSQDVKKDGYSRAMLYVQDIHEVENVVKRLQDDGFEVSSLIDIVKDLKKTASMIQAILGGIGAVSLLVAALGITNTMIMSIYERTREIGVMKVIGAGLRDIRDLFLIEAALIGFFGGAAGNLLSLIVSFAINYLARMSGLGMMGMMMMGDMGDEVRISLIPWWLLLAALVFAVGIGVVSGYYPARRAMKLSALESLRNE